MPSPTRSKAFVRGDVLVQHITSVLRDRFEATRAGRLKASSMRDVERLVAILLEI